MKNCRCSRFDSKVEIVVESVAGKAPENEATAHDACSDSDRRNTSDSEALAKKVRFIYVTFHSKKARSQWFMASSKMSFLSDVMNWQQQQWMKRKIRIKCIYNEPQICISFIFPIHRIKSADGEKKKRSSK